MGKIFNRNSVTQIARVLPPDLASLDVLNRQCHRRALPACAFLARVLRIARASLDRVLSEFLAKQRRLANILMQRAGKGFL